MILRYLPIQAQQFFTLLVLFGLGKTYGHIIPSWLLTIFLLTIAYFFEYILLYYKHKKVTFFSYSPLSTSLGILLMLASSAWWVYLIVLVLTILQKHLLTVDNMHFFNPSNFALIAAIAIFYNTSHIVTGQLGDMIWLNALVVILSFFILLRVDRWVIPSVFVFSYLLLQNLMIVGHDPVVILEDIYERFYAVSFVLFIIFMLTDPRTTPDPKWQQAIFAIVIAFIATYLDRIDGFRVQHLFMALFISSAWVPTLKTKKALPISLLLFILALGIIIFVENRPPYYFEMEG